MPAKKKTQDRATSTPTLPMATFSEKRRRFSTLENRRTKNRMIAEKATLYQVSRPSLSVISLPNTGERPRNSTADRKSTRLNSSHVKISYAVFCLKKKRKKNKYD